MNPMNILIRLGSKIKAILSIRYYARVATVITILVAILQVLLAIAAFWFSVELRPIKLETGIYFHRGSLLPVLIPENALFYAAREDRAVLITPLRFGYTIFFAALTGVYVAMLLYYGRTRRRSCGIEAGSGIVSLGVGGVSSLLTTVITQFLGCCGGPTVILAIPLIGGVAGFALGGLLSVLSVILLLFSVYWIANRVEITTPAS